MGCAAVCGTHSPLTNVSKCTYGTLAVEITSRLQSALYYTRVSLAQSRSSAALDMVEEQVFAVHLLLLLEACAGRRRRIAVLKVIPRPCPTEPVLLFPVRASACHVPAVREPRVKTCCAALRAHPAAFMQTVVRAHALEMKRNDACTKCMHTQRITSIPRASCTPCSLDQAP